MKQTLLLFLSFFIISFSQAQTATLKFKEVLYDFGKIQAKAGAQTHKFTFENVGKDTLTINKIKVSEPSLEAISDKMRFGPGEKGTLTVIFTPKNESGKFQKYISIRSNDKDFPVRQITINADVTAGVRTIEDDYPEKIGNLCFKTKHISFDMLKNTETRIDTFKVFNTSKKPMTMEVKSSPAYLSFTSKPSTLAPGKAGMIIISYNAEKSGIWGLNYEPYALVTDDSLIPSKTISIGVNVVEDFSKLTDTEKNNPPKLVFDEQNHDFGELKQGGKVSWDYHFNNTGKRDLVIRRVKASCGCTAADPEKTLLKPGESSFIKVNFNTNGLLGDEYKTVMVISNDPDTSMHVLTFSAKVVAQ